MAQHIWTVPCRFSMTDRETNNMSLIEVLEQFTVPAVPPKQPNRALVPAIFDVVTLWGRDDDEQEEDSFGRLSLISPNGETLLEYPYQIDLRENKRFRSAARIVGVPARQTGRYQFRIEQRGAANDEWQAVASIPLIVKQRTPAAAEA